MVWISMLAATLANSIMVDFEYNAGRGITLSLSIVNGLLDVRGARLRLRIVHVAIILSGSGHKITLLAV